jgi:hypothetical protein
MDILHPAYRIKEAHTPLITAAIHAGHHVRSSLASYFAIDEKTRLQEEAPGTDFLAGISDASVIARQSRFVVDFDGKRDKVMSLYAKDCRGAQVWKNGVPAEEMAVSRRYYDEFYADLRFLLDRMLDKFDHILIYDIHSYNYRHHGSDQLLAHHGVFPDVRIDSGKLNRKKWQPLIYRFINNLSRFSLKGRPLLVRENTRSTRNEFFNWIFANYGDAVCVLTLSFKNTYLNERSGEMDHQLLAQLKHALAATTVDTLQDLDHLNKTEQVLSPYYVNGAGELLQLREQI